MKNVVMAVTGSISAYKAADIANELTKAGCAVDVMMTKNACEFVSPLTFQTLTKRKVYTDMFESFTPSEVEHISYAQRADVLLVAPASANIIAKAAAGIADDAVTSVLLAVPDLRKIIFAPAMNTHMYENPLTQRNMETLKGLGCSFIEPREARLACGDVGKGALAEVSLIVGEVLKRLGAEE